MIIVTCKLGEVICSVFGWSLPPVVCRRAGVLLRYYFKIIY